MPDGDARGRPSGGEVPHDPPAEEPRAAKHADHYHDIPLAACDSKDAGGFGSRRAARKIGTAEGRWPVSCSHDLRTVEEPGADQIGIRRVRVVEHGLEETGAGQIGASERRRAQDRAAQIRPAQVCPE